MTDIGDALRGARAYLTDHPEEAHYRDSAAIARVDAGLGVIVDGPDGASLRTDMPPSVGGAGAAPSPGWYLRAAHAACVATLIAMRAAEEGVALDRLEVTVDSESDDRGITGTDDAIPAGPFSSEVRIAIAAEGVDGERLRALAEWGWHHCPVDDAMRRAIPVSVTVDVTA